MSLVLVRDLGDKTSVATSPGNLTNGACRRLQREPLDRWATNHLFFLLALSAMDEGDYDRAAALAEEKLALNRDLRDIHDTTVALILSGMIALVRGDHERAADLFEEDLRLLRKLGDTGSVVHCLLGISGAIPRGEPVRAARLWGAAEALQEATGSLAASPFTRSQYDYENLLATVRSRLEAAAFQAAWAEGRAMSPERAVEYAL